MKKTPAESRDTIMRLDSVQQMEYIELIRAGDQEAIERFRKTHRRPLEETTAEPITEQQPATIESLAGEIQGLSRQLEVQEDLLVGVGDGLGDLGEKIHELTQAVLKIQNRVNRIDALRETLEEVKALLLGLSEKEPEHVEWPE